MTERRHWRILLVEDDAALAAQSISALERRPVGDNGEMASVELVSEFDEALSELEEHRHDLLILDIRKQSDDLGLHSDGEPDTGDEATPADLGLGLFSKVRGTRFIPIIFYSAVAHLAEDLSNPPFVSVIDKLGENDSALREAVSAVVRSQLPTLNRAISSHVGDVVRVFMQRFVEGSWSELQEPSNNGDLAYLLTRQLARSFDGTFITELTSGTGRRADDGKVHPTRLYVIPPSGEWMSGDVIRKQTDGTHWLILTPSCDLVLRGSHRKAEHVLLVRCENLSLMQEYVDWKATNSQPNKRKLKALMANNRDGQRDRHFFLPAAWGTVPDLVADFQQTDQCLASSLKDYDRVATLDDPYAQSLVVQFSRYLSRVGTPDLDIDTVIERLS
jgi:CheY-like chemotaxis protein